MSWHAKGAERMPHHVKATFSSKFLCHNFTTHKTWFLGPAPSDGTQKYRTVSFLRSSQFFPIGKIKKYTSGLKKILKIFPSATDIILGPSAKNLDFIPYGYFFLFSLFCWIGKIKKHTSVLKKILKIFPSATDIILSVSAKNLDFIPNGYFFLFSLFCWIGKIKKHTFVLKKILKIFLNVTDIIVSVSAKNLDFILYIELVMAN